MHREPSEQGAQKTYKEVVVKSEEKHRDPTRQRKKDDGQPRSE